AAESKVMRGRYGALLDDTSLWDIPPGKRATPGRDKAHLRAQAIIALTETGRLADARRPAGARPAGRGVPRARASLGTAVARGGARSAGPGAT
ncbi:hypothetical protein, partial [Saccharothrix sp. ST-888]|uniref:hypothetical protein n=1 Tax=Saccharothrix sp. ST-888 TaxID=1427391 RepID=UPI0005EC4E26